MRIIKQLYEHYDKLYLISIKSLEKRTESAQGNPTKCWFPVFNDFKGLNYIKINFNMIFKLMIVICTV